LIGCGAYANEEGSATIGGHGESIMKVTLARQVVYNMENGQNAQVKNGTSKYLKSCSHYLNDKAFSYLLTIISIHSFIYSLRLTLQKCRYTRHNVEWGFYQTDMTNESIQRFNE
jgi:hypothetical protein